jgi:pteridine reductase
MNLNAKTALVTGGAVRIGRAICEALAAEGCRVVVHCHRSRAAAARLAAELRAGGAQAWGVRGALRTQAGCERVVAEAWRAAGRLDILVNNAAVFHKDALATATERKLQDEFRINLFAPVLLTRAFARRARTGKVINLVDRRVAGHDPACLPYVLSKQALAEFTRVAALDLAPRITVNAVAPGAVLPPPGKGSKYLYDRAGRVPLRRPVTPADVAQAVAMLLQADAVTGQVLFVDGGQHLLGNEV